jgi:hypothetical protein
MVSNVQTSNIDASGSQTVNLGFNYGGLEFEYIFFPDEILHFSAGILLAGGGTAYTINSVSRSRYATQDLLVWEPRFNIENSPLKWLHFDLNLSYRFVRNYNTYAGIRKEDLSGLSIGLIFKFGSY